MKILSEHLNFDQARIVVESANEGKDLFMKGICIQGGVRNANQRVYPVNEIGRAVTTLNEQISGGYSVLGEVDHVKQMQKEGYGSLLKKMRPTKYGTEFDFYPADDALDRLMKHYGGYRQSSVGEELSAFDELIIAARKT